MCGIGTLVAVASALTAKGQVWPGVAVLSGWPAALVTGMIASAGVVATALLAWCRWSLGRLGRGRTEAGWSASRVTAGAMAITIAVLVPALVCDALLLAAVGYLPMGLVGSLISRTGLLTMLEMGVLAQSAIAVLSVGVVLAVLAAGEAWRGDRPRPRWQQPHAAARWGRVAVGFAVAVPTLYALSRICWALGWKIGVDAEAYAAIGGDLRAGLGLAGGALLGAALTMGLVRPWGERFWSWAPVLGGSPVPIWLAVIPASLVAVMLLPAGISMISMMRQQIGVGAVFSDPVENWAAVGTTFLWPLWSIALAVATLGYALRRDGAAEPIG